MNKDKLSSLIWLGVSFLICMGAFKLDLGNFNNPGPGFLPFIVGITFLFLSLLLFIKSSQSPGHIFSLRGIWSRSRKNSKVILTILILFSYAVGVEYLGFLLSTFLFLAVLLGIIESQHWMVVFSISLAASIGSYIIFGWLLQSNLPKGILGF